MANPYFRQIPNFEYVNRDNTQKNISDYTAVKNLFKRGKIRDDIFNNLTYFNKYQIIGDERPDNVAYKVYNDETLDWVVLLSNNITNIQSQWPLPQNIFDSIMLEKYETYENLYSGIHHYETKEVKNSRGEIIVNSGVRLDSNWKNTGNFVSLKREHNIISMIYYERDSSVEVVLSAPIEGLVEQEEVSIFNSSVGFFNGTFKIIDVFRDPLTSEILSFTYFADSNVTENLTATITGNEYFEYSPKGDSSYTNSYYYEFYDNALEQIVRISSNSFVIPVTNYEYESKLENDKRTIVILKPSYLNVIFNDMDNIMEYKKGSEQYLSKTLKRADNIRLFD